MKKPELLIPAGSWDVFKTAVRYGADAVYIGGEAFGLRAAAKNFDPEEMDMAIRYAHEHGVKVHVTANILAHDDDLNEAEAYLTEVGKLGPDAFIVADPGMFEIARRSAPDVDVHISTQANNTNYGTYNFWWKQGAKRVVAARELSLSEIKDIRGHIDPEMEIETFIHGAMCISYSGRCLLSNYLVGRDANQGACTHPCRWKYSIVEEERPGEYMPVFENERGTYIFNSKDLCMIEHIPEMLDAGIDSFKVEGRMKTALYVATVARTYRNAIDDLLESEDKYRANLEHYKDEIGKCTYREFTTGFFFGKPTSDSQIYDNNTYVKNYTYIGTVESADGGRICFEQKNKFCVGDELEVMKPDGRNLYVTVKSILGDGVLQESAPHPQQALTVEFNENEVIEIGDIIRAKA
ncbi:MAG: U32 family peptidase [Lachnospiraceae bacterium]|nr:U32 family peptidase [Lachnospiraceae bacterium]